MFIQNEKDILPTNKYVHLCCEILYKIFTRTSIMNIFIYFSATFPIRLFIFTVHFILYLSNLNNK